MLLTPVEQLHMKNLYGVTFPYRCDKCRSGMHNVLNQHNATMGGKTYCAACKGSVKLSSIDTVEFIPKENRPSFIGKDDKYCVDCDVYLKPMGGDLVSFYKVKVSGGSKAVCSLCYHEKYEIASKSSRGSSQHPKVPSNSSKTDFRPGSAMAILLEHFEKHKGKWLEEKDLQKLVKASVGGRLNVLKLRGEETGGWKLEVNGSRWRMV